ncbi:hypothetical protein [Halobaculum sp. MBLA0143]|uniref:hypothetical protein n=1 Tax=Halobaculum sp. MBLA0143 TaxID=3079933 RepID=UPI00352567BC
MARVSLPSVQFGLPRGVVAGLLAGLPVLAVYLRRGFSLAAFGEEPAATLLRQGFVLVGSMAVAGVPVALYVRYGTVSPLVVAGVLLVPTLFERNPPETPAFGLLLFFWPMCVAVYLAVAGVEYALRHEGSVAGLW